MSSSDSVTHKVQEWILSQLSTHQKQGAQVIGISGAQGIGKTTLCRNIENSLNQEGYRTVSVSIDDFYFTRSEQQHLSEENSKNPYLQQRGYPGTHDLGLGASTLQRLRKLSVSELFRIPQYDKSAFEGRGDRAPADLWKEVRGPVDVILFEGWMLGFQPVESRGLEPSISEINRKLQSYSRWWNEVDSWVLLDPVDFHWMVQWRSEAEENMKKLGKSGMTSEQVKVYGEKFLPAYECFLPGLRHEFEHSQAKNRLRLRIDRGRGVAL